MKIELTKVKIAKFASHETTCFEATVVIDGKVAGTAWNDGQGGANRYEPRTLEDALKVHTAPMAPLKLDGAELAMDPDLFIGELIDDYLSLRDMQRQMRTKVIYEQDGKLWSAKPKSGVPIAQVASAIAMKEGRRVLNLMPLAKAFDVFKQLAVEKR